MFLFESSDFMISLISIAQGFIAIYIKYLISQFMEPIVPALSIWRAYTIK